MVYIAGCPMREFVMDIREHDGCVVVRLDDRRDPEFWLEMTFNEADLHAFVVAHYRERVAKELGVDISDVEITNPPDAASIVLHKGRGPWIAPDPSMN